MPLLRTEKRFFDLAETVFVARELGFETVTYSTVKKAAYQGDRPLKRTKIGGRVYFSLEDIENWITSCKVSE